MRAISVAFSPARPSRLKNEPGILPAAYIRSSTSTVSGRKSTSRRLPAVAVARTTVSPALTTTAPEACLAILPVSKAISVPPISTATRCTSDICPFHRSRSDSASPLHRLDASVVVDRHGSKAPVFGHHTLVREQVLPGTPDEVFPFFGDAANLEAITPPWLKFQVVTPAPIE